MPGKYILGVSLRKYGCYRSVMYLLATGLVILGDANDAEFAAEIQSKFLDHGNGALINRESLRLLRRFRKYRTPEEER